MYEAAIAALAVTSGFLALGWVETRCARQRERREWQHERRALLEKLAPGLDLMPPEERKEEKIPVYLGPVQGWDYEGRADER